MAGSPPAGGSAAMRGTTTDTLLAASSAAAVATTTPAAATTSTSTAYPFPPATLEHALRSPPAPQQVGVCVSHLVAHRSGTAAEVLAELLEIPQALVLRLIWFGAVYWSLVPPLPHGERAGGLPPDHLARIRAAHQAAVARWGKDSRLHTPRRLSSDEAVTCGGYLRVHCHPKRFPAAHRLSSEQWRERIMAVRPDHVVVSKPPGLQVPPTVDNVRESLLACVEEALSLPAGALLPAHRLDAGTEGVVVLARSPAFASYFRELMGDKAQHAVRKTYRCLVAGPPPDHLLPASSRAAAAPAQATDSSGGAAGAGTRVGPGPPPGPTALGPSLVHWVLEDQRRPGEMAHTEVVSEGTPGALRCELRLERAERVELNTEARALWGAESAHEVTVSLVTGRTHQVRVQLAAIGLPLLGDHLYGALAARGAAAAAAAAAVAATRGPADPVTPQPAGEGEGSVPTAVQTASDDDGSARPPPAASVGVVAEMSGPRRGKVEGPGMQGSLPHQQPPASSLDVPAPGRGGLVAEWCRPALDQQLAPIALQAHSLTVLEDGPMGQAPVEYSAGEPWWRWARGQGLVAAAEPVGLAGEVGRGG